jgi:glycolate oxidase iron-sulfur subunit
MLDGCVQPAMVPAIDAATARVLDALGVEPIIAAGSGCCGAIRHNLNVQRGALGDVCRNIDAWWPHIEGQGAEGQGVEAIVVNASGCGAMLADYGHLLRDDPAYAAKAARVSALACDLSVFLAPAREALAARAREAAAARAEPLPARVAFHPPCTLQHGQQVRGAVESLLSACGAELQPFAESHLCCGSAGTYSVMQPTLSMQLRDRKLEALHSGAPEAILSANIGCLTHLQSGTVTPVRHWIEWVDRAIGTAHA